MQCSIPALRLAIVALNVFCHCFRGVWGVRLIGVSAVVEI